MSRYFISGHIDITQEQFDKYYKEKIIETLHKNDILHGDVYFKNIVIDEKNNDIKFIDFEFAKMISLMTNDDILDHQYGDNFPDIENIDQLLYAEKNNCFI